jgi:rhamnosyltransferase subunit B
MSKIVLSTMGSLGDLHPKIALGRELRQRGHDVILSTWDGYRDKVIENGLEFASLRPSIDPDDTDVVRRALDSSGGPEFILRELILPNVRDTYADLAATCEGADLLISGEIVYAAKSISEISGIKWISTSLAPLTMFSAYDPPVYPQAPWIEYLRPLPAFFHSFVFGLARMTVGSWFAPYREFRRELGLDPDHDPAFTGKFSSLLHLVLFSRALGEPQPDWPANSLQAGFCFFDESESTALPPELESFLDHGEPPIIFTLGSAAVMDARDFFDESAKAAKLLGRRAVLLYGRDQKRPDGLSDDIVAFEYAPYSLVFPKAACVVHQAGVGTTGQVLRAGVPHLIMPFSHDQPDNAAHCRRAGVAEIIDRTAYTAESAANALRDILNKDRYLDNAKRLKSIVDSEHGTKTACDAIEVTLHSDS